jgi:hypothetical protein
MASEGLRISFLQYTVETDEGEFVQPPMMPTHLRSITTSAHTIVETWDVRADLINTWAEVGANLCCSCGEELAEFLYPGAIEILHELPFAMPLCDKEHSYYLFKTRCTACEKEWLIFDNDIHGYNAIFCSEDYRPDLPRPSLVKWHCQKCGSTVHRVSITINYSLDVEVEDIFDEPTMDVEYLQEVASNVFGAINIALICSDCGQILKCFASSETM